MIEINKTKLSDHNLIEISTNYKINQQLEIDEVLEDANSILRSLNFYSAMCVGEATVQVFSLRKGG